MRILALLLAVFFVVPISAYGVSTEPPFEETVFKAEVLTIESAGEEPLPATGLRARFQWLSIKILEGARAGQILSIENTSPVMLAVGDRFYLHRTELPDGSELLAVGEPDRSGPLLVLLMAFVLVTILAAGVAGIRSLIALVGSFLLIVFLLLPLLSSGAPPAITSVLLAVGILAFSMFVTHGIGRTTLIALLGSVASLVFAALLAEWAVRSAKLSGFVSDETVFLNLATGGTLNLPGLLLGGILVGIVGILNDVSVSQVHTVAEIHDANPSLSRLALLRKAMKVGREHLGAVVNTLPLAYAGASLPLLLLFASSEAPLSFIINREIFAAEIIRTLAGGVGLMGSGVIATLLAVYFLIRGPSRDTITTPIK